MPICKICNIELGNNSALGKHITHTHKITTEEYYNEYISSEKGKCKTCGRETKFISIPRGYANHCCRTCVDNDLEIKARINTPESRIKKSIVSKNQSKESIQKRVEKIKQTVLTTYNVSNVSQLKETKEKIKNTLKSKKAQYCIENNCTPRQELIKKYGQGWLKLNIPQTKYLKTSFIDNNYLDIIENYVNYHSIEENIIYNYLSKIYDGEIIRNSLTVLRPLVDRCDLDFYLPELNLAIEYNSNYYHNINRLGDEYYHYNKSKNCWLNGIRLIHIYEFENLYHQLFLLKKLIYYGVDLFDNNDNNKNWNYDNHKPILLHQNPDIYGA